MIQDQVTSLKISKRLKELGVKQESSFYWTRPIGDDGEPNGSYFINWKESNDFCDDDSHDHKLISAFTAAELGSLLPQKVRFPKNHPELNLKAYAFDIKYIPSDTLKEMKKEGLLSISKPNNWTTHYFVPDVLGGQPWTKWGDVNDISLANSMAKALIYLLENKLIS